MNLAGVQTAPEHFLGDYPAVKWMRFAHTIPADLSGRTVLDIGCNAGFYSFEMKRRGAARVLGIDTDERYLEQARFAAQIQGLDVEFERRSVYDVAEIGQKFDIVLFLGVLYHLRYPLLALDLLHHVVKDLLVVQSMLRGSDTIRHFSPDYPIEETRVFSEPGFPRMFFIEERYSHDPTNWWIPNRSCLEAMIRVAGFELVDHPERETFVARANRKQPAAMPENIRSIPLREKDGVP
jgi:tRNA (mo5U34)-methyltransferase